MKKLGFIPLVLLSLVLPACSSTEVIEPDNTAKEDNVIALHVSAPDAYDFPATRVDENLQLRYVAKLYRDATSTSLNAGNFVKKQEILAKDGNNLIMFTGVPEGKYTVTIFADYIPASSIPTNGHYRDQFYDTTSEDDYVYMLAIEDQNHKECAYTNINNDNYDCFAIKHQLTKDAYLYEKQLSLKRIVSKVSIKDNGTKTLEATNLKITKFSYLDQYKFNEESADESRRFEYTVRTVDMTTFDNNTRELFYFYTFGSKRNTYLHDIEFKITGKDKYEYKDRTLAAPLSPKPNYKYNLLGNFIVPTKEPNDEIHLTVSADQDWENEVDKPVTVQE